MQFDIYIYNFIVVKLYLSFCANGTYDSMPNVSKNLIVCESPYDIAIFVRYYATFVADCYINDFG